MAEQPVVYDYVEVSTLFFLCSLQTLGKGYNEKIGTPVRTSGTAVI